VHSSTCFEAAAAHQQQLPGQSCSNHLACSGLNGGHQLHQQAQQHRGSNSCEVASGGNWSIAAGPSLGWNTASTFFNKYRLGEVMGSGTFGEVRTAVHLQTGKPRYAVKVLSKHRIEVDAIRREVQTWQQAQNSKYVAKLEGLFEVGGTLTQTFSGISPELS
jgi:serine/threonine protein kinase